MGFRFRKSVNLGPLRINLSKSGVGYSVGTKGFRVTKKATGGVRTTASIPGTGVSYVSETSSKKAASATPATDPEKPKRQVPEDPFARPDPPKRKKPKKPIYARTWFIALCVIFFLAILGAGSQGRSVRQAQEDKQREQHQTVEEETTQTGQEEPPEAVLEDTAAPEDPEPAQEPAGAPESSQEAPEVQDPTSAQETPASEPAAAPEAASEPQPEPAATPEPDPEPSTNGRTVYITETGSKYHYDGNCGNGTYYPTTLDKAQSMGLTPCAKCAGG